MQIKSSLLNNRYFELNGTKVIHFRETISYCMIFFKIISKKMILIPFHCFSEIKTSKISEFFLVDS